MTHIGFEIENNGTEPFSFDGDKLRLDVYGQRDTHLSPASFVVVAPLGPTLVSIDPATTVTLEAYFELPVRPRAVESMRVRWCLRTGDAEYTAYTHFVRDDNSLIIECRSPEGVARRL